MPQMHDPWSISTGTPRDYAALAPLHYRAPAPRAASLYLVARDPAAGADPIGVLVVARAVLNGPWRECAWPGHFSRGTPSARARRINRELRVIARVIVDPRYRGLGLAVALVRAYLREPLTMRTEALAAMGVASPFFARAGMRAVETPPSRRTRELLSALAELHIEPASLACPARLPRSPALARAIRRWAAASRATRHLADGPLRPLLIRAAAVAWPTLAFVHDRLPECRS